MGLEGDEGDDGGAALRGKLLEGGEDAVTPASSRARLRGDPSEDTLQAEPGRRGGDSVQPGGLRILRPALK